MSTKDLEQQIVDAFADVPAPPARCLSNSREGEEPWLLEQEFRDKTEWRSLDPAFLDQAPDGYGTALSFFSDEAFRFYLPAYLLADLAGRLERADVVFHLTHGLDDGSKGQRINERRYGDRTWYEHARHRFAIFTIAQARAITAYLRHKAEQADLEFSRRRILQALDHYWLERSNGAS